jgi:hypothetical protein
MTRIGKIWWWWSCVLMGISARFERLAVWFERACYRAEKRSGFCREKP